MRLDAGRLGVPRQTDLDEVQHDVPDGLRRGPVPVQRRGGHAAHGGGYSGGTRRGGDGGERYRGYRRRRRNRRRW